METKREDRAGNQFSKRLPVDNVDLTDFLKDLQKRISFLDLPFKILNY